MSTSTTETTLRRSWHTPPKIGERLGVSADKVVGWIKAGELSACNLAAKIGERPRYRVSEHALQEFLQRRSVAQAPKPARRRKAGDPAVHEYF